LERSLLEIVIDSFAWSRLESEREHKVREREKTKRERRKRDEREKAKTVRVHDPGR
jgi:hypothetical protein